MPVWNAADLHVHTDYSDGEPSPAMVVARAADLGLRVVAITDHDSIEGALEAARHASNTGCEVIVGEEITTRDGHVIGLFLTSAIAPGATAADTVEQIHAQDGLAIPAHPYLRLGGARGVGQTCAAIDWDAVEVENGSPGAWFANRQARARRHLWARAETGGSDAHILDAVGVVQTRFPGATAADLRAAILSGTSRAVRARPAALVSARTLGRSILRRLNGDAARELARRRAHAAPR
jgi:predicted metal-dependent phosphoesterase TrpH